MAMRHIVRRYPNPKVDEFKIVESGLFEPADEARVKMARKMYVKKQKEEFFLENEGKIVFTEPIMFGLIGLGIGAWTTGLLGSLVGAAENSALWMKAGPAYQKIVAAHPELFAALSLEAGVALALDRFTRNKKRKSRAERLKKQWERLEFKNDELIHVFAAEGKLDSKYDGGQLYWLDSKAYLPKTAMQYYQDKNGEYNPDFPEGHARAERERRSPLKWTRFHRDGTFRLYVGELHERKGQFNDHPELLYIPYSGLVTGCAIFGPTGSGKSQTLALPFLDQGIGYYHWIDSERDAWFFKTAVTISNLKSRSLKATGSEKEDLEKQIKILEESAKETLEAMASGDDAGLGYSKMTVICVEPKDEIWATQLKLCKRFNRVNDYIELGVVKERYQRFQEWSTRLNESITALWGYAPNEIIRKRMANWLFGFGSENGIISSEQTTTLWYRDAKTKQDACKKVSMRIAPDKIGSTVLRDLDGVYGDPKKMKSTGEGQSRDVIHENSNEWINRAFARSNHNRRLATAKAESDSRGDQDDEESSLDIQELTNNAIKAVPLPWVTLADLEETNKQSAVLGFGFGLKRDPWVVNASDAKRVSAIMRGRTGQKVIVGSLQRMALMFALVGDRPRIKTWIGDHGAPELVPEKTSGSLLTWDKWRSHYVESIKDLFQGQVEIQDLLNGFMKPSEDWDDFSTGGYLPFPNYEPNGVLQPPQSSAKEGEDPCESELVTKHFKESLNLMPAERREAVRLRKRVRAAAPPSRRPMERKYGFRMRYSFWRADRRRIQFNFMEGLLRVLFSLGNDGFEVTSKALELEGKSVQDRVLASFFKSCPSGMLEALAKYALNASESLVPVVKHLRANGYEYYGDPTADVQARGENEPYDALIHGKLRASWATLKGLCEDESIPLSTDGDRYGDLQSHLKLRRVEEAQRDALVITALLQRNDLPEGLVQISKHARRVLEAAGGGTEELLDPVWVRKAMDRIRRQDLKTGAAYDYETRVPTIEPITDDPEDFECAIDCEKVVLALGPWDALWSEAIGAKVWDPLREVARDSMVKAVAIYAEQESELAKVALTNKDGASLKWRDKVERSLKVRRDECFKGCMAYLGALEGYLRTVSPYYKSNTALPYGFKDPGGIGDCCGATKFNPLHHPDMTPSQTAGLLLGILGRNAGSGDTPFWNDSGVMISDGMMSLMRAARGYMTVADLNQMIVSDAFVDLIIAQAEARIQAMRSTSGGSMSQDELKRSMFLEQWKAIYGLVGAELQHVVSTGECPAEVAALLPRAASGAEIKELEGYLNSGRTFITSEWRSDTGSFADKEIRSTCKLNLINQLTPVTQGIGAYSFSPEDPDEISFPSPTEMRNTGNVVATRFNYAIDKKLGSIVIGMFIVAYQMMVLSAKQRQTEAKDTFSRISRTLKVQREALVGMRARLRELKNSTELKVAPKERVQEVLAQAYKRVTGTAQGKAAQMVEALLEAEQRGLLEGVLGPDSLAGVRFLNTAERSASLMLGNVASDAQFLMEYLGAEVSRIIQSREETLYANRDLIRELEGRIWSARQDILNGLSELEEFPDWSRLAMLVIDEAHFFLNANSKGSVLTDTDFLSTARAGKSINVYITQTPSSIKGQGMSLDTWEQWISNTLLRVCLGAPNKSDQEYFSDLFRGEKVKKEKEASVSISFSGADTDEMSGSLRASEVDSGSRTYQTVEEHEKYVTPDDLARMPVMSGWVDYTDGQRRFKPTLCYFPPYFAMVSDKVSKVTGEPLATKSWMALVRDGELNLVPPEDERMREIFGLLAQAGHDVSSEIAELEEDARMRAQSGAANKDAAVAEGLFPTEKAG